MKTAHTRKIAWILQVIISRSARDIPQPQGRLALVKFQLRLRLKITTPYKVSNARIVLPYIALVALNVAFFKSDFAFWVNNERWRWLRRVSFTSSTETENWTISFILQQMIKMLVSDSYIPEIMCLPANIVHHTISLTSHEQFGL